jgi:hypothetical protein
MSRIPTAGESSLSFDHMYEALHNEFGKINDHRRNNSSYSLQDVLSGAFAMFSLKSPSLLNFSLRSQQEDKNLLEVYRINKLCSDTQMRQVLDKLAASKVRDLLSKLMGKVKRSAFWDSYRYYKQMVIISIDGVEHFSSQKVHCEHCLSKEHKSAEITYSHSMLAAVMVHPHQAEVLPLDAEPVLRQDGGEKNDCERNAARRLLAHLKESYPKLKALLVADALYANGPHLEQIQALDYHYLVAVKPDSHKALFKQVDARGQSNSYCFQENKLTHQLYWENNLPLCSSQSQVRVNFLHYRQVDATDTLVKEFTWITDLPIRKDNALLLARAGRSRWKIENETFNTLKNQGYHFEHNYGHGQDQLSTVLAYLMLLAFSVDQIQQGACKTFRAIHAALKTKAKMWESLRAVFKLLPCLSLQHTWFHVASMYRVKLE